MRKSFVFIVTICVLSLAVSSYAELQNVTVGGEIKIRGRYDRNVFDGSGQSPYVYNQAMRPLGPGGIASMLSFDDDNGHSWTRYDQLTKVNVKADFTEEVTAFIELDSRFNWGRGGFFRSNYINGMDGRAGVADVQVYQAYIEAREMYGYPLRLRVGRQELKLGKGFLVGNSWSFTAGLSFDAIRLTYAVDDLTIDAFTAKLADISPVEEDGDTDLYGIYGTYTGLENVDISLYYLLVRDAMSRTTNTGIIGEFLEDVVGVDDYEPTYLNTIGTRVWGAYGAFDYDVELAYQFGEADAVGSLFPSLSIWGTHGDDGADFGNLGLEIDLGYTFDVAWNPRVFADLIYFEGEDNRDAGFLSYLFNTQEASVSFNRLFSSQILSNVVQENTHWSNVMMYSIGVTASPTEKIGVGLRLRLIEADETFDMPLTFEWNFLRNRRIVNPISIFPFFREEADDDIGIVSRAWIKYNYSEDLWVGLRWEHLFAGDGAKDGNFVAGNGLINAGGTGDDDADEVRIMTAIKF